MDIKELSGGICCRVYEKENQTKFRDCLRIYIDGRICFERYCYGEAAGMVFNAWASGIDEDGVILWVQLPEIESRKDALPRAISGFQDGAISIKDETKRYIKTQEFTSDKGHGYSKFKLWLLRRK